MSRIFRSLIWIIAIGLVVAALFVMQRSKPAPMLRLDTPQSSAPPRGEGLDFSAPALRGGKVSLSQYRGHPVIVDFWATWCAPCRKQIPELNALYKKYNKSRGLIVLGVSCDPIDGNGNVAVEPFVEQFQIEYPIALADQPLIDSLGVEAIPTTFFVRPDGKVVSRIVGAGRRGEITASTMMLLEDAIGAPVKPVENGGHVVDL